MSPSYLRPLIAVALLTFAAACGGSQPGATSGPPADAKRVDLSKAGTLTGRVAIEGPVPANPSIKLSGDPYCLEQHPNGASLENYVADDGGLENVFVYVKDGLGT